MNTEKLIGMVKKLSPSCYNLVSLVTLRKELRLRRVAFDRALQEARKAGVLTCTAAEGRFGLTEEQRKAGIREGESLLLYVSVRQNW